ncbi:MAG: peptidylprolyl isomerase, partial [Candidatus Omnitrophica bacterium]|nr:peptidylprolyl isomerase [Candidatus Omnitrophota bacterium]
QENEQIKVKYIPSLNQDAQKDAGVNDDELRSYYEENKEGLKISIQVNLSYIGEDYPQDATNEQKETINNKFKEISEFIKNGNGLAKAKDKFGLQIQETGFISLGDPLLGIDWTPDDLVKLFNLNPDGITDVIQTPRGPYIFQLKEKRTDYLPSFEEVKENLKTPLVKEKSKELAKSKIENYHSQLAKKKQENPNAEPVKISEELNLPIKETDFFNRYSPVLDIGLSEEFNEASFNLADGQISDVIELAQGYFIIISISERKPIDEAELEKAKEGLKNTLLSEKKNEVFEQFYANLKQKANLIDYVSLQQNQ